MSHLARESEWTVIARRSGEQEGTRLFVAEGPDGKEAAERWLAEHPQPPDLETAIVADPFNAPFLSVPGPDMEILRYHPPSWRIVTREAGQEHGRTAVIDEWSREHLEGWLARNPFPAELEISILADDEDPPFLAPYDRETLRFVPPSRELREFLELAKRGRFHSMPAVEAQARAVTLAVLEHCRDVDDDSIEFAIPELIRWTQEGEDARDEIRELLEVSQ